jgi:hypothetical protein
MPPLENTGAGTGRACRDVLKNVYRGVQMMEAVSIGVEARRRVREVFDARLLEDVLREVLKGGSAFSFLYQD